MYTLLARHSTTHLKPSGGFLPCLASAHFPSSPKPLILQCTGWTTFVVPGQSVLPVLGMSGYMVRRVKSRLKGSCPECTPSRNQPQPLTHLSPGSSRLSKPSPLPNLPSLLPKD